MRLRYVLFATLAVPVATCQSALADETPTALSVTPAEFELSSSRDRAYLLVSGAYPDDSVADLTETAALASLDPQVATVDRNGRVTPRGNGSTEIVARHGRHEARARITVRGFATSRPIDFRTEVIGALSRGGCNQGACHGSPQGKNGFRMSLRGFDPDLDWRFLTHDALGRRLNRVDPSASLLLEKASGRVAHQGGTRFAARDPAYRVLHDWIAEGHHDSAAPRQLVRLEVQPSLRRLHASSPRQRLIAVARFDDGTVQDVTDLAVYTSANEDVAVVSPQGAVGFSKTGQAAILVRFLDKIETARLTFVRTDPRFAFAPPPEANYVDREVFAKQRLLQLQPSGVADDAVFLRRVYLDLIGAIPAPDEAREFLDSRDPDKRAQLIDRLLERDEYAMFWALKWADIMRGNRETISQRGVHNLHRYLVRNFAADRPFDQVAREIVTSVGNTVHRPAANFFRISRTPEDAAESFSQLFLGVRIQCAKCHNHPYESITQNDYYGLSAFFARVQLKGRRFGIDDETVFLSDAGEVTLPDSKDAIAPSAFGWSPPVSAADDPRDDRRVDLADWLTQADNRYFARSTVNRIWRHLMGQGVVEPVDDLRDSNPPSNPELLDALADDFIRCGYRFKPIMRTILNSSTYQLSAAAVPQSPHAADASRYFTRSIVAMLTAEQIIDAVSTATGIAEQFPGYPPGTKAVELAEGNVDHKFLQAFTKPVRDVACDCARDTEPSLNEVVHLMNNPEILQRIDSPTSRLGRQLASGAPTDAIVESLYLATLSRNPTDDERALASRHVAQFPDRAEPLRDLQHALLNSNEFLLRH